MSKYHIRANSKQCIVPNNFIFESKFKELILKECEEPFTTYVKQEFTSTFLNY